MRRLISCWSILATSIFSIFPAEASRHEMQPHYTNAQITRISASRHFRRKPPKRREIDEDIISNIGYYADENTTMPRAACTMQTENFIALLP